MRMLREYLIVECRNNSLTRTSGSHDKIAINTTFTYHRQLIEDLLLMWQYCVFAKHVRSNLRLSYLFQFLSSAETRVSFEDIRLGMQTFYFRIIRNTDFSIRKTRQAFHRLSVRHTAISSGDNA